MFISVTIKSKGPLSKKALTHCSPSSVAVTCGGGANSTVHAMEESWAAISSGCRGGGVPSIRTPGIRSAGGSW